MSKSSSRDAYAIRPPPPEPSGPGPKRLSYTHREIIRWILANPGKDMTRRVAEHFGYSRSYVSIMMSSDLFQARLDEMTDELDDLVITEARASLRDRMEAVGNIACGNLAQIAETSMDKEFLLDAVRVMTKGLGMEAKASSPAAVVSSQTNITIAPSVLQEARRIIDNDAGASGHTLTHEPRESSLAITQGFPDATHSKSSTTS